MYNEAKEVGGQRKGLEVDKELEEKGVPKLVKLKIIVVKLAGTKRALGYFWPPRILSVLIVTWRWTATTASQQEEGDSLILSGIVGFKRGTGVING